MSRKRSRDSARRAGARFEVLIAEALSRLVDDRIERRRLTGVKDRGDIGGVRTHAGHRVVVECKDYGGRYEVGPWLREAEAERLNDDAQAAVVVAKRRGESDPMEQVVFMTVGDFMALLVGERP